MDIDSLLGYCQSSGVTARGLEIVREIAESPPARRVNTRSMAPNIISRFPSRKMGVTIQAESQTLEMASIYMKEFDEGVRAYWDQPFHKADLSYKSGSRRVRTQSTLDFFVISEGFIGFEECKPEEKLRELIVKTPGRYQWSPELNQFEIEPLGRYLEGTGLNYRVVSDRQVSGTYVDNLAAMYDLLDEPVSSDMKRLWNVCADLLAVEGPMRLVSLERALPNISRLHLLVAIAQKRLFVDLKNDSLSEPERVMVGCTEKQIADLAGVENTRPKQIEITLSGSTAEQEEGFRRLKLISPILEGGKIAEQSALCGVHARTLQRWIKSYNLYGLDGLVPKHTKKGNRGSKIPVKVEQLIGEVIQEKYLVSQAPHPFHVYNLLVEQCNKAGLSSPSRQSFYRRIDEVLERDSLKIREGAKSAYQATAYDGLSEGEHGEAPFQSVSRFLQRCHIDHTQIDLQLLSIEGANLGKPWLTTIIDEYSGFVLSSYLSFRNPSSVAVMSAIRLMVKRHEVMPEAMVVDGGKEFESFYFERLMAKFKCNVISRKGKPRSGGAVERNYGTLNTVFLDNLNGNNKLAKNIRRLSASHKPKNLATWEAVDFYHGLLEFSDSWNMDSSKKVGMSPDQLRQSSVDRYGLRYNRIVRFDSKFLQEILIPPTRPTVRLRKGKKVQVNRVSYWHGCLKSVPREGTAADVLYDPFDLNYVLIFYRGEWIRFKSITAQHRNTDDLDGAIVAEVARQAHIINEKSKSSSRPGIAAKVNDLNQAAVSRHQARSVEADENPVTPTEVAAECGVSDKGEIDFGDDLWSLEVPDSDEGC